MTEYEKIVNKMINKYPHARAAFQYFLEQSHYDSMEEFLFDYGYMIDYDLEKYTENEYFYKDGMNNLYYDTIKRRRIQRSDPGDTDSRYFGEEQTDENNESNNNQINAEVDMDYSLSGQLVSAGHGHSVVLSLSYQDQPISNDGWSFYYFNESQNKYIKLDSNRYTVLQNGTYTFRAQKQAILTEDLPFVVDSI